MSSLWRPSGPQNPPPHSLCLAQLCQHPGGKEQLPRLWRQRHPAPGSIQQPLALEGATSPP